MKRKHTHKTHTPILSESYVVKFWFQKEDRYWEQRFERYCFEDKNQHYKAVEAWKKVHRNDNVKFISVIYE